jgi:hypothetical protein
VRVRHVVMFVALALASCGGGTPSAPSGIAPSGPLPVTLSPGAYTLTITLATTGMPTCTNGFCTSLSACSGNPDTTPARFDVQVERDGEQATITSGGAPSLRLILHTASVPATGAISGSARDLRGDTITVAGTLSGIGSSNPGVAASGSIDGQVDTANGGCTNNGHGWSLAR